MDELIVAQVNANVRDGVSHEAEEHEIPREQFSHLDVITNLADGIGTMGQRHSFNVIKNVPDKTAAIETVFRAEATSAVGSPFVAEGVLQQILQGGR
jgi:hypothetical protein